MVISPDPAKIFSNELQNTIIEILDIYIIYMYRAIRQR